MQISVESWVSARDIARTSDQTLRPEPQARASVQNLRLEPQAILRLCCSESSDFDVFGILTIMVCGTVVGVSQEGGMLCGFLKFRKAVIVRWTR